MVCWYFYICILVASYLKACGTRTEIHKISHMTSPAHNVITGFTSSEGISLCILWMTALRTCQWMSYYIISALWHFMIYKVHTETISFSPQDNCEKERPRECGRWARGPVPSLGLKMPRSFSLSPSPPPPLPSSLFLLPVLFSPPHASPPLFLYLSPAPPPAPYHENNPGWAYWRTRLTAWNWSHPRTTSPQVICQLTPEGWAQPSWAQWSLSQISIDLQEIISGCCF